MSESNVEPAPSQATAVEPTDVADTRRIDPSAHDVLFNHARSANKWTDEPVSVETLHALYDLLKFGPTSANCSPARFLFLHSREARDRLAPALSGGNLEKTLSAPVVVIVAYDPRFYEKLPTLFPHNLDAKSWFTSNEGLAATTAFRNGTLQGAYLIMAARSLGLDAGPMSGFDNAKIDEIFLADRGWRSNFLVNLGHGDPSGLFPRSPRLSFEEACLLL